MDITTEALVHGGSQPCQGISVAILRSWDLVDAISVEGLCCHGDVFGMEVMIDLMND